MLPFYSSYNIRRNLFKQITFSILMEGKIVSFRRGRRTQKKHQMIVKVSGVDNKEKAKSLLNKKVLWKSPGGKEIKGVVTNIHGNLGGLRVQFEKGLPGQSLGSNVVLS